MNGVHRVLTVPALCLGLLAFVVAVVLVLIHGQAPFGLTPAGVLRGAQSLLLIGIGAYCAARFQTR